MDPSNEKQIISSIEQFASLPHKSGHYRPEWYLSKYQFTKEVLLDVFCTDYNHWCYEDYYYDDICLDMIAQYQPDIDIKEFANLWKQLDIILEAEFMSRLIIDLFEHKKLIGSISDYKYDMISGYFAQLKKLNQTSQTELNNRLCNDYIQMLKSNKYICKLKLPIDANGICKSEELVKIAQYILSTIPEVYSSLLPVDLVIENLQLY